MNKTERVLAIFIVFLVAGIGLSTMLSSPKDNDLKVHRPEPGLVCVTAKIGYMVSISCVKEEKR